MVRKIKKIVAVILIMLMTFANVGLTASQVEAKEKVKIEFWYGLGSEAGAKMEELIKRFNESQDEVEVKGVAYGDYTEVIQKVQAAMSAGKVPGAFMGGERTVKDFGRDGLIVEVAQFEKESDLYDATDFNEVFVNQATSWDGEKQYAVPAWASTQVMYYNKDVYKKAGVDPEWAFESWENLREASKKIVKSGAAKYGHLPMWGQENLYDLALSNGAEFISEDGKQYLVNSKEWVEAWDFVRGMVFEDKVAVINSGGQGWEYWYKTIDMVMNGQAASYTGSSGDKGDLDFKKIGSFPQPGLNGNDPHPTAPGNFLMIPAKQDKAKQAAAFKWFAYFTSPEIASEWSMKTGYIAARKSTTEVPEFKKFVEEHPEYQVPYDQALNAHKGFVEPTQGDLEAALDIAKDKVELQNFPAKKALDEAQEKAQKALDELNKKK